MGVLWLTIGGNSLAFELLTHQRLSQWAVGGSVLTTVPEVLTDLGLKGVNQQTFPFGTSSETIPIIIGRAARMEDDGVRPIHHFFDPTRAETPSEGGARFGFVPIGSGSPSWALEDRMPQGGQDNSFADARQLMMEALTYPTRDERDVRFASMFQTIGMVIHHLQDMTQPQHVRNDLHCLSDLCQPFLHNPSAFERYTEDKFASGYTPENFPSVYTEANRSILTSARRFWFTGDGKGIAEFTNRNFVSAGTNFRYEAGKALPDSKYGYPVPLLTNDLVRVEEAYAEINQPVPPAIQQYCGDSCWIEFVASAGLDQLTGESFTNQRASALSLFDHYMQLRSIRLPWTDGEGVTVTERVFSLNSFNFEAAHQLLFKRAIGYSAGLIDYFFRGKIDLLPDSTNQGQYLVKNLSAEPMKGKFRLYYDDATNTRREVLDATGAPVVWDTHVILGADASAGVLAAGATMAVPGFPPPVPAPKVAGEYMLVFSGDMGEEKADLNTGAIGAVVGKLVRPYNGALYFAALNGSNQVQYFKLDRSGLSALGVNEPNPLAPPSLSQGNPVAVKQSVISKTASGGLVHRTAALIARSNTVGTDRSLVADLATGALQWKSGLRWTARSEDPAIGVFEFNMIIADQTGYQAYISYDRRFTQNGQPSQASGAFLLPNLNVVGAGFNYTHIRIGELFVNGQGTLLYPRGNSSGRSAVQITLGSVPSAALVSLPQGSSTHTTLTPVDTYSDTGRTCTLGYIDGLSGPATVSSPIYERVSLGGSESTNESIHFEGITADPESPSLDSPVSYRLRTTQRTFHSGRTESCLVSALDFSGSASRIKMHAELRSQSQQTNRQDVETTVGNQTLLLTDNLIEPVQTTIKYTCGFGEGAPVFGPSALSPPLVDSVNYTYEGFCPAPEQSAMGYLVHAPGDYGTVQNRATPKKRVSRALTHQMEDALYYEVIYDPDPKTVLKFRDTVIPTPFVAETSPLGEVFIATQDFSVIEHHPKYGMPVLKREMIPQGITRLVGVVWM